MASRRYLPRLPETGFPFLLLLLSVPFHAGTFHNAFAAGGVSLEGFVRDTLGVPVPSAVISVEGSEAISRSDWTGRFSFEGLPAGRRRIEVSAPGYLPQPPVELMLFEGTDSRITLTLTPVSYSLPPVNIRGMKSDAAAFGDAASISRAEWQARGASTVAQALASLPGVTPLQGDHSTRLSIRGSHPRAVSVYLDGVLQNDPGTGEADLELIPLADLGEIVVEPRGEGGVVKLTSRKPERESAGVGGEATAGIGSFGRREYAAGLRFNAMESRNRVSISTELDDGNFIYRLDDGSEHRRINNSSLKYTGSITSLWVSPASETRGGLHISSQRRGVPGLIYSSPTPEAEYSLDRLSGSLGTLFLIDNFRIETQVNYAGSRGEFESPPIQRDPATGDTVFASPEWSLQESNRIGGEVEIVRPAPAERFAIGYRIRSDAFRGLDRMTGRTNVGGVGFGDARRVVQTVHSGYRRTIEASGWRWTFAPQAAVEFVQDAGVAQMIAFAPAARIGAARELAFGRISSSLSYSRSVTPAPFNALFITESAFAAGNRNLKPESGGQTSLAWTAELKPPSGDVTFSGSLFHRKTRNFIVWRRNAFGKFYPDNLGRADAAGMETSFSFHSPEGSFSLAGNYILIDSRNRTAGDANYGNFTTLVPRQSGSALMSFAGAAGTVALQGRWVGRRYSTESNRDPISTAGMGLKPYAAYDLTLRRTLKFRRINSAVEFGVNNILNESYRVIERNPTPGRAFTFRLSTEVN